MSSLPMRLEWLLDNEVILWEGESELNLVARDLMSSRLNDLLNYTFGERAITRWLVRSQDIDTLVDQVRRESSVSALFSDDNQTLSSLIEEAPTKKWVALRRTLLMQI